MFTMMILCFSFAWIADQIQNDRWLAKTGNVLFDALFLCLFSPIWLCDHPTWGRGELVTWLIIHLCALAKDVCVHVDALLVCGCRRNL